MANHISALKRVRQDRKAHRIQPAEQDPPAPPDPRHAARPHRKDAKAAAELLPKAFSLIDRSAKIGIIKKNTAARYKSKLHLRVKALAARRGTSVSRAGSGTLAEKRERRLQASPVHYCHGQNKLLHHDAVVGPRVRRSRSASKINFMARSNCALQNFAAV